jgi:hypothetical protein
MLRRPCGKCDLAAGFENAQHFLHSDSRPRREHMAEHNVELSVRIGQCLDVAFDEIDVDPCNAGVLACALD